MKKILFIVATLIGLLTIYSCEDFLDAENKSKVDSDTYFTTKDGFENAGKFRLCKVKTTCTVEALPCSAVVPICTIPDVAICPM